MEYQYKHHFWERRWNHKKNKKNASKKHRSSNLRIWFKKNKTLFWEFSQIYASHTKCIFIYRRRYMSSIHKRLLIVLLYTEDLLRVFLTLPNFFSDIDFCDLFQYRKIQTSLLMHLLIKNIGSQFRKKTSLEFSLFRHPRSLRGIPASFGNPSAFEGISLWRPI